MQITRFLQQKIEARLFQGKIIILYGARQVGKTTLVKEILKKHPLNSNYYNCEEVDVQIALGKGTSVALKNFFGNKQLIVLDEAQKIKNIGNKLKLLIDNYPEMQIIATGSSSFELSNSIREPLTGRKFEFFIPAISVKELYQDKLIFNRNLENLLRFGLYPDVVNNSQNPEIILREIATSYLYKDIFNFQEIRSPELILNLLQLLALQIGGEVSYYELSQKIGLSSETIERYIYLLEQAFVIFRLPAFSRNLCNEVSKTRKIYFWDIGIRNSLIQNTNQLQVRNDIGGLWENFCIVEKIKQDQLLSKFTNNYFWRTYQQKEIDFIQESAGNLETFEFKWNPKKINKIPKLFQENYPNSTFKVINPSNFWDEF